LPAKKVRLVNSLRSSIPCRISPDHSFELCCGAGQIQERFVKRRPPDSNRHCQFSQIWKFAQAIMDLSLESQAVRTAVLSFVHVKDRYKRVLSSGIPRSAIATVGSHRSGNYRGKASCHFQDAAAVFGCLGWQFKLTVEPPSGRSGVAESK
jgi:hypothetical protein